VLKESEYRTTLRVVDDEPVEARGARRKHGKATAGETVSEGASKEGEGTGKEAAGLAKEGAETTPSRYFVVSILPPDFLRSDMRSGDALADLYRTIASGVGGTAMPAWIATAPYTDPSTGEHWDGEKDIWALAHYVRSLVDMKGTPRADAFRRKLLDQPAFAAPL
jgi:hypothetical protein